MDKCDKYDFKPRLGFTISGPMVPGTGPITAVTLFAGHILAVRNDKVWCLTNNEWVEVIPST